MENPCYSFPDSFVLLLIIPVGNLIGLKACLCCSVLELVYRTYCFRASLALVSVTTLQNNSGATQRDWISSCNSGCCILTALLAWAFGALLLQPAPFGRPASSSLKLGSLNSIQRYVCVHRRLVRANTWIMAQANNAVKTIPKVSSV